MPHHHGSSKKSSRKERRSRDKDKERSGMNKYQVLGVVGEGAYGVVMRCRNKKTGKFVAMKKFKESGEKDEAVRKTILREVKVLKMMRHATSSVVQLIESFRRKGRLYLVFEFVDRNLLEVIEENPEGLSPTLIHQFIYQLCAALVDCHSMKVLHRDIKPENLLVTDRNVLKLCDFGFARVVDHYGDQLTDYVATRWYRSPELLVGDDRYGPGVDIWAVACIMGELADGDPLFPGDSEIDQLFVIQKLLGPITHEHMQVFLDNPRFMGLQFPDMSHPDTLPSRYEGTIDRKGLNFMSRLLAMDPKERYSAEQCLEHPVFDGIRHMYPHIGAKQASIEEENRVHHHGHGHSNSKNAAPHSSQSRGGNGQNTKVGLGMNGSLSNATNTPSTRSSSMAVKSSTQTSIAVDASENRAKSLGHVQLANAGISLYHTVKTPPSHALGGHKKLENFSLSTEQQSYKQSSLLPTCRQAQGGKEESHRRSVSELGTIGATKQVASFVPRNNGGHHSTQSFGGLSSFPGIDEGARGHGNSGAHSIPRGTQRLHSPMGHKRMVSSDFSVGAEVTKGNGDFYKKTSAFSFGIM